MCVYYPILTRDTGWGYVHLLFALFEPLRTEPRVQHLAHARAVLGQLLEQNRGPGKDTG